MVATYDCFLSCFIHRGKFDIEHVRLTDHSINKVDRTDNRHLSADNGRCSPGVTAHSHDTDPPLD